MQYMTSVKHLRTSNPKVIHKHVLTYPCLESLRLDDLKEFHVYIRLERISHVDIHAMIDVKERQWASYPRLQLPAADIANYQSGHLPAHWRTKLSIPAILWTHSDFDFTAYVGREGEYAFDISDLIFVETPADKACSLLKRPGDPLDIVTVNLLVQDEGSDYSYAQLLSDISDRGVSCLGIDMGSSDLGETLPIFDNLCAIRRFPHIILYHELMFWKDDIKASMDALETPVPLWSDTQRRAPDPGEPLTVKVIFTMDDHDLDDAGTPHSLMCSSIFMRRLAAVVLLIGGAAAEYSIAFSGDDIEYETYDPAQVKHLLRNVFQQMLRTEIARLIAGGRKGNSVGWRKLSEMERRPMSTRND